MKKINMDWFPGAGLVAMVLAISNLIYTYTRNDGDRESCWGMYGNSCSSTLLKQEWNTGGLCTIYSRHFAYG